MMLLCVTTVSYTHACCMLSFACMPVTGVHDDCLIPLTSNLVTSEILLVLMPCADNRKGISGG